MDRLVTRKPAHPFNTLKWVLITVISLLLLGAGGVAFAWGNKTVHIQVDNRKITVKTSGDRVSDALKKAEITIGKKDYVYPGTTTMLTDGMKVVVDRAKQVIIYHDGKKQIIKTRAKTVKSVLKEYNIKLGKLDKVEPSLETTVKANTTVTVTRIRERVLEKEYSIPFGLEKRRDESMLRGMRKVIRKGSPGRGKKITKVIYENGKEISRELVKTLVIKEPKNQIMAFGTVRTVSRGGRPLNFRDSRIMEASGYTHTGYRTSSGKSPVRGVVAVDSSVIPMGTRLYIDGYGYAVAADRGSAIVGNRIDLFFESYSEAVRWGRRNVRVYILE